MCLYSKSAEALIASADIPIYKILRVNKYGEGRDRKPFFSPIYDKPVAVPSTLWTRGGVHLSKNSVQGHNVFSVGKGMIHCYPCDKLEVINSYMLTTMSVIAYGYIPKGTSYYEETEEIDSERNLCAKKIRLEGIAAQSETLAAEGYLPDVPSLSQWLALKVI